MSHIPWLWRQSHRRGRSVRVCETLLSAKFRETARRTRQVSDASLWLNTRGMSLGQSRAVRVRPLNGQRMPPTLHSSSLTAYVLQAGVQHSAP